MKLIVLAFLVVCFGSVIAGEPEIRSYEVGADLLKRVAVMEQFHGEGDPDPFAADDKELTPLDEFDLASGAGWFGPLVKEAGFESRFLKGVDEMRECARRVREIVGHEKAKVEAVYDVNGGRLIVNADLGIHRSLKGLIESQMPYQMRTTLSVYQLPGVNLKDRSGFWEEVPKEAKMLREVSWLSLAGQGSVIRGVNGSVYVEAEQQWDANDDYTDSRLICEWDFPGGGFSWKTGLMGVLGVTWAQEVGSLDGETTLMLVRRQDRVLSNGKRWDRWILKEEGGLFLNEESLEMMRWRDSEATKMDFSRPFQVFEVPATFETFLVTDDGGMDAVQKDDFPELKGVKGELVSARRVIENNGITFGKGDFVVFQRGSSRLLAKLSEVNLELLDMIVHAKMGLGPPEECYVEFAEVEGEDFRKGKVLKKIGVVALPGQEAEVTLGDDLAFQVEMQLGRNGVVEVRATLTEEEGDFKKASLRTGVVMKVGQPLVVRKTFMDGKHRNWVATVRVKVFEKELDEFLKKREEGK